MTDQPQSSADIVELGAQALADDVWHPPVKLEQMARHEANKFRRQARLVIEAASSSDGEPSNGKQPLMASRPAPPVPSDQIPTDAQPEQVRNAALEEAAKLVETTGLRNPDNIARDIRCLAFQPTPAATVETKSAPGLGPSQNNAERLPSSDAAGSGAGTHLSVGTNQFETTKAGVIDWKIEAERANRLLAQAERPKCKLCGLEDGACICAHLPPQCSAGTEQAKERVHPSVIEMIHQRFYRCMYNELEGLLPEDKLTGEIWLAGMREALEEIKKIGGPVVSRIATDALATTQVASVGDDMPRHAPQTIETAPRDGTHILAWRIPVGIRVTNNTNPPTVVHWFNDPDEPGFYTSVNERAPEHPFNPTHWERLPDPPLPLSRPLSRGGNNG